MNIVDPEPKPESELTIAQQETLDLLDPLRHLRKLNRSRTQIGGGSDTDTDTDILPPQPASIQDALIELSFPSDDQAKDALHIKLAVDASPGCGGIAWPAGTVLATYLSRLRPHSLTHKTIIELGSGTGLVGLVAGLLGGRVIITDQLPLLGIMEQNVQLNALSHSVTVAELNWGEPLPPTLPHPDLILAADCVYFEPAFPLLVRTLSDLVVDGRTEVLFCYKKRRKADKRFFALLKKKFTWEEVTDNPDRETYSREAISLLRLHRKQPS